MFKHLMWDPAELKSASAQLEELEQRARTEDLSDDAIAHEIRNGFLIVVGKFDVEIGLPVTRPLEGLLDATKYSQRPVSPDVIRIFGEAFMEIALILEGFFSRLDRRISRFESGLPL
ncbi:hypothetical protein [Mycobacteroides abscessus]|uniref:hypothetical protein n=1 Tax=Mycobacteroides abscessus TaxID=36809 RepID=UPI0018968764